MKAGEVAGELPPQYQTLKQNKMSYSFELKKKLAHIMAEVDKKCMGTDYQKAYEYHLCSESFELLEYWLSYFGVFDGGEDMLQELNLKTK